MPNVPRSDIVPMEGTRLIRPGNRWLVAGSSRIAEDTMRLHPRLSVFLSSLPLMLGAPSGAFPQEPATRVNPIVREAEPRDQALTRTGARRTAVVQAIERVKGA